MTGAPISDRRAVTHPDHAAELTWMREHHRDDAWIDAAVEHDLAVHGEPGAALAHILGEHLSPDPDSALAEFVVYDILDPRAVLAELDALSVGCRHAAWTETLRTFVTAAATAGFAGRDELEPPRPMLYVSRAGCDVGRWVDMTRPERTVEQALSDLPGDPADTAWTVHARMGFFDLYPVVQPELWMMNAVGQGIDRHGEAYAAYAEHTFQQGMSEHDFEARYRCHVETLEEFVHLQAEERGWLAALRALNAVDGLAGAVSLDMEVLVRHVFATGYSYEPGAHGFHIFGPPII